MIKSRTKEPDKKQPTNSSGPSSGKGNSFFSEEDDNDNLFDGNVLKNIEMVLADDDDESKITFKSKVEVCNF